MTHWFPGAPPPRNVTAPRYPSGKIDHRRAKAEAAADALPYFGYAQRLQAIDPDACQILMLAHLTPGRKLTGKQSTELGAAVRKAEDPRMGYPLGRLWATGLLCPAAPGESPQEAEGRDERAELLEKAGRIYAAQHYIVWTGFGSPGQRVPSHLEKIMTEVWGDDFSMRAPEELDPEEVEKERLRLKASLAGARSALFKAFPLGLALKAVERVVIDKFFAAVHPSHPVDQSILKPLRAGLAALCEYYNVRNPPKRDRAAIEPVHKEEPVAPVERRRGSPARRGLPIEFGMDTMPRPTAAAIAASIKATRLRVR